MTGAPPRVDSVKGRVAHGAMWLSITRAFINLLSFANVLILARLLTPADFGLAAIGASLLAIAASLTELSLSSALVHQASLEEEHFHSVWTISVIKALTIATLFSALAVPLAHFYHDPRLAPVFVVCGLTGAITSLTSPKTVLRLRNLIFWQEFVVQVGQRGMAVATSILLAWWTHSYWAIVLGATAGAMTATTLSFLVAPYRPAFSLKHFRQLFSFSFWLSAGEAINTLNWRLDQVVMGYFLGRAPLGVYSVADTLSGMPTREAVAPIGQALFPALTALAADRPRQAQAYLRAQAMLCALAFPAGFGFAAIANTAVPLVLGVKWQGAVALIQILGGTFALQMLSAGLTPLAMSQGETRVLFNRDVRTFLIRIPFIAAGLWLDGLMGVVIARAIASFIGLVWNMQLVRDLSGLPVVAQFRSAWRPALATTFMLLALWLSAAPLNTMVGASHLLVLLLSRTALGGLVYLGVSMALWTAAGRPIGCESEVLSILAKLRQRGRRIHIS